MNSATEINIAAYSPVPEFQVTDTAQYKKVIESHVVKHGVKWIIKNTTRNNITDQEPSGIKVTSSTENSNTIGQAHDMQPLLETIRRPSTELAAVRAEIANLHQQVTQLQEQATQQSMSMNQPTHHEDDNHLSSEDFSALSSQTSPWNDPQRISQTKHSLAEHEQQRRL
ncbi:unnamed protein product [Rhizopus microsporus]|uniref:Uncharacterized protein n=1 Tax=Rhizopus microsporus TaxID=58291 RepID=A0A1X0RVN3_RHIZD|nr:hypothetical protein BCV71DRAFT_292472 [Rhizopus microsporus]